MEIKIIIAIFVVIVVAIAIAMARGESLTQKESARIVNIVNRLDDQHRMNIFDFSKIYGEISPYKFAQLVTLKESGNLTEKNVRALFKM